MEGVVGVDLSLNRTGMCFVPAGWGGDLASLDYESVETKKIGESFGRPHVLSRNEIERWLTIANRVVKFIRRVGVSHVAVERYAYSTVKNKRGVPVQSSSVTSLAEMGGTVKSQILLGCRIAPVPLSSNTARKRVVGTLKMGKKKQQVKEILEKGGLVFPSLDEMDAFVVGYAWYCDLNTVVSALLPQQELL